MGPKYHTIIFVPHARARFRKLRVSNRQLLGAAATAVTLLLGSLATTIAFLSNEIDRQQLARIKQENEALLAVNRSFAASLETLDRQLGEFEQQARQLAIVAGLDQGARRQETGVGGQELPPADPAALSARAERLEDRLAGVADTLAERSRWLAATPSIAPVKGVLTSAFGPRIDPFTGRPAQHAAIDISTGPGQPVRATADGIVLRAGVDGSLGIAVAISHGYGLATRYGHLERSSVSAGQKVRRGDIVGYVGSTGRSTGYHLHYEVLEDGDAVNPLAYILDGTAPSAS